MNQPCEICEEIHEVRKVQVLGKHFRICFHCFYLLKLEDRIFNKRFNNVPFPQSGHYYNEWKKSPQ
jgi:hypothetical protein